MGDRRRGRLAGLVSEGLCSREPPSTPVPGGAPCRWRGGVEGRAAGAGGGALKALKAHVHLHHCSMRRFVSFRQRLLQIDRNLRSLPNVQIPEAATPRETRSRSPRTIDASHRPLRVTPLRRRSRSPTPNPNPEANPEACPWSLTRELDLEGRNRPHPARFTGLKFSTSLATRQRPSAPRQPAPESSALSPAASPRRTLWLNAPRTPSSSPLRPTEPQRRSSPPAPASPLTLASKALSPQAARDQPSSFRARSPPSSAFAARMPPPCQCSIHLN